MPYETTFHYGHSYFYFISHRRLPQPLGYLTEKVEMTKPTKGQRFVAPHTGKIPDAVFSRIQDYLWSPKLNGHRALLSASEFISRGGRDLCPILPENLSIPYQLYAYGFTALEGELVLVDQAGIVQNDLGRLTSVISNMHPHPDLRFFVFDAKGPIPGFEQRIAAVRHILDRHHAACPGQHFIHVLPQFAFPDKMTAPRDACVRSIAAYLKGLPYQSEGFVLRARNGTYEDPNMYKMIFLVSNHQTRVQLVRMGEQTGTVVYPDGSRKEIPFTAKAKKTIQTIAMNMPNVRSYEVVVDTYHNKIVGLGTDWL